MFSVTGKGITTKHPELRYSSNDTPVCNCTLVNHETYNDNETSHFTSVVLWGDVAEAFAEEVVKGCLINITKGILKHPVRESGTGKNKKKYYNTEVVILEYELERNFNDEKIEKQKRGKTNKGGKKK